MRVLIVDDSVVFRSSIKTALDGVPRLEVVGTANNGKIALQKLAQSSVDLVTLDMEMPEMGGIETIREIKKAGFKVRIIVFSAHTTRGSEAALEALSAGADDFVAKPTGDERGFEKAAARIKDDLLPKILQFLNGEGSKAQALRGLSISSPQPAPRPSTYSTRDLSTFRPSMIVIGSSTGGPPALEACLSQLSRPSRVPILIAQHMPPVFTASLAKRLKDLTGVEAAEGIPGEPVLPNRIYVAPGDFHMVIEKRGAGYVIALNKEAQRNSVRPSVDVLFESVAEQLGSRTLGVVLTGMGEDGLIGSRRIKELGGGILIQNRESCVVFGMPGAVYSAGLYDGMGNLIEIQQLLKKMTL